LENRQLTQEISDFESRLIKDYATTVTILEHLSDAVFILNRDGEIEYANKIALDSIQKNLFEIAGRNLASFLIWNDDRLNEMAAKEPQSILNMCINHQLPSEVELSVGTGSHTIPVVISFGAVRNNANDIIFIIASAKDISIRKELENEIKRQQAFNLARNRFRELGEQAIRMVHDVSQPLTSIRLMVDLTRKLISNPEVDKDRIGANLDSMIKFLDTMASSVDKVRNFAFRTEDDSSREVDIMRIIHDVTDALKYEFTENDIQLMADGTEETYLIFASPIQILKVFETAIRHLMSALKLKYPHNESERIIRIQAVNVEGKWLQIFLRNFDPLSGSIRKPEEYCGIQPQTDSSSELETASMVMTTIGGDLQIFSPGNHLISLRLRLPLDKKEERDQLMNLIELMRD